MSARYKAKSGGIVATMEDMLEKAKAELADGQKAEMNAKFDFDMLKQKLEDAIAVRGGVLESGLRFSMITAARCTCNVGWPNGTWGGRCDAECFSMLEHCRSKSSIVF